MLLSLVVFLPMVFALLLAFARGKATIRMAALVLSIVEFLVSLLILKHFDIRSAELQLVENVPWVSRFGINYFLGIDGISLWLVILTTFLLPITVLASWKSIDEKVGGFHICLFALQTAMLGTFLSMDSILFYVFWELSLIPMYFIIGIWGGPRRIYATVKFFLYTMLGSVLMLIGIIYMIHLTGKVNGVFSASFLDFYKLEIPFVGGSLLSPQALLFFAFALAFAIKVPLFPFHTWLPDAHVEAPTPGSVILAGVMLKMGTYGFMRLAIPLFPEASVYWSWLFCLLAVAGIIYGALVAMVQTDIKKLVAYSSVSHMGYVILGLFALNSYGATGALYQMLSHGISTGALFLLVGMIYERTHSREISKYGGLAIALPIYSIVFFIVTLSSIAVPITNGFIGEFFILLGAFAKDKTFAIPATLGVVLGATYMLWMFKKVFFGVEGEIVRQMDKQPHRDLSKRELGLMLPLLIVIFWMGIFPDHFLRWSKSSLDHYVNNFSNYELTITPGAK
ncbi:MAG: NADH-quinone oxidoreductase subunit M [Pseudomonadota bacterium]|nr:NADH-quinone oxidoreductase subunit M [Pseudomonadota bacterium]